MTPEEEALIRKRAEMLAATNRRHLLAELDDSRDRYHDALARVHAAVIAACPGGSDHHVIQHRDGKPPWCPHCGRNSTGTQIREPK